MALCDMKFLPRQSWNPDAEPPMHTWLKRSQSDEDRARLGCVGNAVMPGVAAFGMQLIAHDLLPPLSFDEYFD